MTKQIPTPGRIVLLAVSEGQARQINANRTQAGIATKTGNTVREGDVFPLVIVRVWDAESGNLNGQLLLDGNDTYWASSVHQKRTSDELGAWDWPVHA